MTRAHCGPTTVPLTCLLQFATGRSRKHTLVNTIFSFCEHVGQGQCVCSLKSLAHVKSNPSINFSQSSGHFPNSTSHPCPKTSTIHFKILLLTFNQTNLDLPNAPFFARCRRQPDLHPPVCHRPLVSILTLASLPTFKSLSSVPPLQANQRHMFSSLHYCLHLCLYIFSFPFIFASQCNFCLIYA